jgi:hypothetical protein
MPEGKPVPQIHEANLEAEAFVMALQQMKDQYALALVNQTFFQYENDRQRNHDIRWNTADMLYVGYVQPKVWEGTNIPRSALPMPLVFDQVETALPAITQALFGTGSDWFQVEAEYGASQKEARDIQAALLYLLDHDKNQFGLSIRNDIELAIKSLLLYGNGGLAIEWDIATGRPAVSWVDIRDIYVDPGASSPSVDHCRSIIRRTKKTVEEISEWRNNPNMKIPEDAILWEMAKNVPITFGDRTKQVQNVLHKITYNPSTDDVIPNPSDRQIEVLTYYSKTRIIVVLNRQWVAFVGDNPYGFIPLVFAPCYVIPGRFYAMSLADIQESNQRYAEALLNAHIDELHIRLHPPRVQKASSFMTPAQQRWKPGAIFKVADPRSDISILSPEGPPISIWDEIQFINLMSEKRSGINSLTQGIPRASNANRTASGMAMQLQGGSMRLQLLVKHIEDYLIVPLLYKLYKMIQIHVSDEAFLPGMLPTGITDVVSAKSFRAPVRFKMVAASQMVTRERLAEIVPFLIQYMTAGPLLEALSQIGQTVNWAELLQMIQDSTGIGKLYQLVRPITAEEIQKMNQPNPELIAKQQEAQQSAQIRLQMGQIKSQTEIQKALIQKQPDPLEQQREQQRLELEMLREQMKLQAEQQKLEFERQKNQMDLAMKQLEMQLKQQEAQMKLFFKNQTESTKLQTKIAEAALEERKQETTRTPMALQVASVRMPRSAGLEPEV